MQIQNLPSACIYKVEIQSIKVGNKVIVNVKGKKSSDINLVLEIEHVFLLKDPASDCSTTSN